MDGTVHAIGVISCGVFTSIFYFFDIRKSVDLSFLNQFWLKNIVTKYVAIYFLIGAGSYILYFQGIAIFVEDPLEELGNYIQPYTNQYLVFFLESFLIATAVRAISSSKVLPFFSGTVENLVDGVLIKDLHETINEERKQGKYKYVDTLLNQYQNEKEERLNLKILGNKLITYHRNHKVLSNNDNEILLKEIAELKSLKTAIIRVLNKYSKQQLNTVIFHTDPGYQQEE